MLACAGRQTVVQGGVDTYNAISCRSNSAKKTPFIGLFGGKYSIKIRHLMHLHHPVGILLHGSQICFLTPYTYHTHVSTHPTFVIAYAQVSKSFMQGVRNFHAELQKMTRVGCTV